MSAPASAIPPPLCRFGGKTCAACCWGERVGYPTLAARLRRQTHLFARRCPGDRPPRWLDLLLHELSVRGAADLFWALLLLVPVLGDFLRPRLKEHLTCAFLGYEDEGRQRVGCLLHPSRWAGRDLRRHAFALLPGVACGPPGYYCAAARAFAASPWQQRARFERRSRSLSWYAYSAAAVRYSAED